VTWSVLSVATSYFFGTLCVHFAFIVCIYVCVQQLLRNTNASHNDFPVLERCMSHLGNFLTELNGSIEQSMAAVAVAQVQSPSPKPKRRFQLSTFSFQSIMETSHDQSIVSNELPRKSR
jgi:hypothetical protein